MDNDLAPQEVNAVDSKSGHVQMRRDMLSWGLSAAASSFAGSALAADEPKFRNLRPIQFIAALGDPEATSGTGAEKWGLWRQDPGPRGVYLRDYEKQLGSKDNKAPEGWTFDPSSWWVEEHGLIMETPAALPLQKKKVEGGALKIVEPLKRYVVTGGRETTSVLTVRGDGSWELNKGKLYDVTHLPCRSAVYTSAEGGVCKPTAEEQKLFPVQPGAKMPQFPGCNTQDWAVLFVVGEDVAQTPRGSIT